MTLFIAAALMTGCSGKKTAEEVVSAVADGTLTVGIIDGNDRYARITEEGFGGVEPEILGALEESLGVSVVYQEAADTQELMSLLDHGAIDLAAGRLTGAEAYANGRQKTRNYAKDGLYLVTETGSYVDTLAGYAGANIGVSAEIPSPLLLEVPFIDQAEQVPYSDLSAIAADIKEGAIKAALLTEREALKLLAQGDVRTVELRNSPRLETVFYLSAGQAELAGSVNQAINAFLDKQAEEE